MVYWATLGIMRSLKFLFFILSALFCGVGVGFISLWPQEDVRIKLSAQLLHRWARLVLKIFDIHVSEAGADEHESYLSRPHIQVANHVSYLDIPILLARRPALFVAKSEVGQWPLIGFVVRRAGMILVDRSSLWSRVRALLDIQKRLQGGMNVVVFPEGTTSLWGPRKRHANYFAGAFRAARMATAPMEFLHLEFSEEERCAWLGDEDFVSHLWRFLGGARTNVKLRRTAIEEISNREKQRRYFWESREWILDGGRNIFGALIKA